MKRESGFTLIELVVTIAVAAILMAVAIPSFRGTLQNNRMTTQANEFVTAFNMARSEAIRRAQNVIICAPSVNWQNGAEVRIGATSCTTGTQLRAAQALSGGTNITPNHTNTVITYQSSGGISATFPASYGYLQFKLSNGTYNRWLCINRTGRIAVNRDGECS